MHFELFMKIFIAGGAGYIGSHMVKKLIDDGHDVVVYDSLIYGHKEALPKNCRLVVGDLADIDKLEEIFDKENFEVGMHFAAFISMGESMENPRIYFRNNVFNTLNLLDTMVKFQVHKFIFSSSAGVYGNPEKIPIPEDHPKNPTNPYGETKVMVEKILQWYDISYGLKSVCLRYFNAAGASLNGQNGEAHDPETHIIPNAFKVVLGKSPYFELYGNNYPTKDGTCIRDYIHVLDLIDGHLKAMDYLVVNDKSSVYNIGTGHGFSNREILEMIKKVSGVDFKIEESPRRQGDANELVADPAKIKKELGWEPIYSDLETIVKTAWNWHKTHPRGFIL